jgi:hypothetical protein
MYKAGLEPVGFFSPKPDLPVEILGLAGQKSRKKWSVQIQN